MSGQDRFSTAALRWIEVNLFGWRATMDKQDLRLGINHTHLETESQSDIATEDGKELPFRPGESMGASLSYAHRGAGFKLKVWANAEGRSFANLSNSIEVPGYRVLNFKLTQRLWEGLSLFLEGNKVRRRSRPRPFTIGSKSTASPPS